VAGDVARGSEDQRRDFSERNERFAALVAADCATIEVSYVERLGAMHSPIVNDSRARDQAMANALETLANVETSVRAGTVRIDDGYKLLASTIGVTRAQTQLSAADSLRAAEAFFDVVVTSLARHVRDDPELMPCFLIAIQTLNESISLRVRQATLAYTDYLLDRVHQAHLDERYRISRELHDWLGEGLSVAFRQLELHEMAITKDPVNPTSRLEIAKDALADAMRRLRMVTSDLRQDSVTSLEKALLAHIESVAADPLVQLQVTGDEGWASSAVIDETYLIIREAIRNALTHGDPKLVLVGVALTPDELRAWIDDDGRGFVVPQGAEAGFVGNGLASMRERATLIGGHLAVTSVPGQGTHVELYVKLTGRNDVQSA
jgi:signal transduction histidine kinase